MRSNVIVLSLLVANAAPVFAAEKSVCVTTTLKRPAGERPLLDAYPPGNPQQPQAPQTPDGANLPVGQDPVSYMTRLLEYFVTHEKGFIAVPKDCEEHLDVELYPLQNGWTAFARYSGNGREERVDYLYPDELSQFAERAVTSLLYDRPISTTILRDTVLRADSKRATQRIRGTNHFLLGLGTELRLTVVGVPTTFDDGSTGDQFRAFSPITLSLGYRGKFENWGVEAIATLGIGTARTGLQVNSAGGHVDYGGNVSFAVHFLRYLNPRALTSWFLGAGGNFEVLWFYQIRPANDRGSGSRSTLASGGFDVDLIAGVEFMRASKVQFFLQGAVLLPVYLLEAGDGAHPIKTWFPAVALKLGMLF
jgi:hypothetical protein